MKRYMLFCCLSIFTVAFSQAQINTDSSAARANLKATTKIMGRSFLANNYDEYIKYIHPKLIELIGGKEKMKEDINMIMKQMKDAGMTIEDVTFGEPLEIIITGDEYQAIIPQSLEILTNKGRMIGTSYLLAMSEDKGKNWYFADTSGKSLQEMQALFPSLSDKIVIPARPQPVMYNSEQ